MKQTLLIIALFIGIGSVNAQSDATKEETLDWLNIYFPKFSRQATIDFLDSDKLTNFMIKINYKQDGMIRRLLYDDNYDDIFRHEMYLTSVIKIEIGLTQKNDIYYIFFVGKDKSVSRNRSCEGCVKDGKGEYVSFYFSNKTELERVYKALKHLFTFYNQEVKFVDKIALANKF
jgi:hypothetical protein